MQSPSTQAGKTDSGWTAFVEKLEAAELEFVKGRPADFKALWSKADDVTICGGFGNIEAGWANVTARLDWASSKFTEGTRTNEKVSNIVSGDIAHLVQKEFIRFRLPGHTDWSTIEFRATMVFRREAGEWRVVHRHADMQTGTKAP